MTTNQKRIGYFLEVATAIEAHPDAWYIIEEDEGGVVRSRSSSLPEQAAETIRDQIDYLRLAHEVIDNLRAELARVRREWDAAHSAGQLPPQGRGPDLLGIEPKANPEAPTEGAEGP
jgi:hypothetical protein